MGSREKQWLVPVVLFGLLQLSFGDPDKQVCPPSSGTIYDYGATTINGWEHINLGQYAGKTVLIFGLQEPGNNHEILPTLKYARLGNGFVPNFQLFEKGDVNGRKEQGLFTFLKNACPPVGENFGNPTNRLFWEPFKGSDIKWNFEKFLIGPDGKPVMRWFPRVNVSEVRADILQYLQKYNS
ncbi:hypothetical protein AALO_G00271540 [Alosa alosa]|uniref:glutathione peroxidase n=1 Tax=Alosa alosa TaxID=278164 RepID=A0AAV6FQJ9_9TELE|nr:hypothetical protein AALO_G00271540 [Alosa alosa]